jgi:hypothetical protein
LVLLISDHSYWLLSVPPFMPELPGWCIIYVDMKAKYVILYMTFLASVLFMGLSIAEIASADDDFSINLALNGEDMLNSDTLTIDPGEALLIDIRIYNVTTDVVLRDLFVSLTFAGQVIMDQSIDLDNYYLAAGETYINRISDIRDTFTDSGRLLTTGLFRSQIKLDYVTGGQAKTRSRWVNIHVTGDPLNTPAGTGGLVVGVGTLAAILWLLRSLAASVLPKGTILPPSALIEPQALLHELAMDRLEPTARGRVIGSIVSAAKKAIVKEKCPICETRLKHGYCYTCRKSAREVRQEFTDKLKNLALQTVPLLNSGQVKNLDDLCKVLGISPKLGTDVITTLDHAKLVKVKGLARKLAGKAILAGIGCGLSSIIWVTIGGFAALSTAVLVTILVASVIIPLVVTKSLQMKARHDISKSNN